METRFEKLRMNNPQLSVLNEWANEEFNEIVKKTFNDHSSGLVIELERICRRIRS